MKAPEGHRYEGRTLTLGWGGHYRSPPGEAAGLSTLTGRGQSWREAFSASTAPGGQEARTHYLYGGVGGRDLERREIKTLRGTKSENYFLLCKYIHIHKLYIYIYIHVYVMYIHPNA